MVRNYCALILLLCAGPALAGSAGLAQQTAPGYLAQSSGDIPGAPVGQAWFDSARQAPRVQSGIGAAGFGLVLTPAVSSSSALANPTASTTFSGTVTLPANSLTAGKVLRVTAWGQYTTGTGLSPTVTVQTRFAGAVLSSSGAVSTAVSLTSQAWSTTTLILIRTAGASGTLVAKQDTSFGGLLTAVLPTVSSSRVASTAIDTTVPIVIAPAALFGVSDAANAITNEGFLVEVLN